jgi:succinoglycan biosynthesis protein ExoM
MTAKKTHITVCICTFKRYGLLIRLLDELAGQNTEGLFTYSVVVADNDCAQSSKNVVLDFAARSSINTIYRMEPWQNIALARNKSLENPQGEFIAFIDDDEYPSPNWLCSLFKTCNASDADGVLGPVIPYFEQEPPKWAMKGRFFERPTHVTGYRVCLSEARSGNVMFRRKILDGAEAPFRAEFGTGGEDVDFFRRMMGKGCVFIWCNEAVVYEAVPPMRCTRSYLLKRALLRGRNSLKQQSGRVQNIIRSFVAVPVYGVALPFLFIAGDQYFMKYLIKFCDHAGRLLALLHLNPIGKRVL